MSLIVSCAERYGANPSSFIVLGDDESADQLQYQTIVTAQSNLKTESESNSDPINLVTAVYESQYSPLLYLVDGSDSPSDKQLQSLRITLAMRGDAPYMGVASDEKLDLYPIALDNRNIQEIKIDIANIVGEDVSLFAQLSRNPDASFVQSNWIAKVIRRLMLDSIDILQKSNFELEESISLVGRALFTRFLADRKLLPDELQRIAEPSELFDNPKIAKFTSECLDLTFNGDFLPLTDKIFTKLTKPCFQELGNILNKAPGGQFFLAWENLDFAHVPVGILSQVYESVLKRHYPDVQESQSAYYTPSQIVNLMVKQSIQSAREVKDVKKIKILDPAAGAGVYLITAFRELVMERMKIDGTRPDTKALRTILENQITGFEINESALRFAALGLYLMAIELDPNPDVKKSLKFNNLRGNVLHHLECEGDSKKAKLGSLNSEATKGHQGKYDIVIGNPPWRKSKDFKDDDRLQIEKCIVDVVNKKGIDDIYTKLPARSIDLAFVWRSMQWAKDNGVIALVLHSRSLFQQQQGMPEARTAIFDALDVRSIIDCTKLNETRLWPNVKAPFCLLFARNKVTAPYEQFQYYSPNISNALNAAGRFQLDESEMAVIANSEIRRFPQTLKLFSVGSIEDFGIFERMRSQTPHTMRSYLTATIGRSDDNSSIYGSGLGYEPIPSLNNKHADRVKKIRSETPVSGDDLEVLKENIKRSLLIGRSDLCKFSHDFAMKIREPEIYIGPILLVDNVPSRQNLRLNVSVCDCDARYNKFIYGYSLTEHQEGPLLARFLCLILRSKIVMWQILLTSGRVGVERNEIKKNEVDELLIPDFDRLSKSQKSQVARLFDGLNEGKIDIAKVDEWATKLYGLGSRDLKVISDTLNYNAPYPKYAQMASESIIASDVEEFLAYLKEQLGSLAKLYELSVKVERVAKASKFPWECLNVCFYSGHNQTTYKDSDLQVFERTASTTSSSEFMNVYGDGGILVGKYSQKRYWNFSQARLLTKKIAWTDIKIFDKE